MTNSSPERKKEKFSSHHHHLDPRFLLWIPLGLTNHPAGIFWHWCFPRMDQENQTALKPGFPWALMHAGLALLGPTLSFPWGTSCPLLSPAEGKKNPEVMFFTCFSQICSNNTLGVFLHTLSGPRCDARGAFLAVYQTALWLCPGRSFYLTKYALWGNFVTWIISLGQVSTAQKTLVGVQESLGRFRGTKPFRGLPKPTDTFMHGCFSFGSFIFWHLQLSKQRVTTTSPSQP